MFAMTLLNVGCTKPNDAPELKSPTKTLEQQFPDWKNLTWVSTDNASGVDIYPKLNISISGDIITIFMAVDPIGGIITKYTKMVYSSNTITFSKIYQDYNALGNSVILTNITQTNSEITFIYAGNKYVLKIN
jgi:hypothetical protein